MTLPRPLDRRRFLTGAVAGAAMPGALSALAAAGPAAAQTSPAILFGALCRELTGFDALPRGLMADLLERLSDDEIVLATRRSAADLPQDLRTRILRTLFLGVYSGPGEDAEDERLVYAQALMFACVEDRLNVPSYCGGMPGYWRQTPAS